jgi:hypothetical protein
VSTCAGSLSRASELPISSPKTFAPAVVADARGEVEQKSELAPLVEAGADSQADGLVHRPCITLS